LEKALANDPDARRLEFQDHVIWEIVSEDEDLDDLELEGLGDFGDMSDFGDEAEFDEEEDDPLLSNAAISVVKGSFVLSSHVDLVKEMIQFGPGDDTLADDIDYKAIRKSLVQLGDGDVSGRLFTRAGRELQASYELVRQGKMPESEGLIGRMLNRFLGSDEKGVIREAEIDGQKMPDYEHVKQYLGPGGLYLQTEDDGWYVVGMALRKTSPALQVAGPALTTAAAEGETIEKN
jgi:hypothetical protein